MGRLRRLARWAALSLAALLLGLAAGVIVIETDWFKNWLRLKLVNGVTSVLDGELRVARLGGSLWRGVTLDGVEVWNRSGQVIRADHIRVRYDPFTLARRRWIVESVTIERASVQVVKTSEGWNVLRLTRPRPTRGAPPTVVIRQLRLLDSTVAIDGAPGGESRRLTNVNLDTSLTATGGAMEMTIASLRAFDETTGLTLRNLTGSASDNFRRFDVTLAADSPETRLAGSVRGDMVNGTRVLTTSIDTTHVDLARLTGRPRLESDITGHVNATATFPGGGQPARLTFAFAGPRSSAFGYTADRIDATGEFVNNVVRFDARVAGYGARADIKAVWRNPGRAAMTFEGRGSFTSVDVRRMPTQLRLPALDSRLAGRFDTVVDARSWRVHSILSEGVVEGTTLLPGTEAVVVNAGGVTSYGAIGRARHVDLRRFGGAVPVPALAESRFASDLSGEFFVAGEHSAGAPPHVLAGGILEASTIAGTSVPALEGWAYLFERRLVVSATGAFENLTHTTLGVPSVPLAANGRVDGWFAIADLDQPLTEDNIEGSARVDLGPSTIRDKPIVSAAVDASLLDGLVTLRTLDLEHAGATVRASGALGLHEPLAPGGVIVAAEIRDRTFLEQLTGRPVLAAGSVDATITGTIDSPSATGTVALQQVAYDKTASALTVTTEFTMEWPQRNVDRLSWKVTSDAVFATIAGTELQRLTATAIGGPREMAIDVKAEQQARSLGIEGQLTLMPDARQLLLRSLTLSAADVQWMLPAGTPATIRYGTHRIDVTDLTLVRDAQRIDVAGGFILDDTAGVSPAALRLDIREVELADINRVLLGTRQLTGRINGVATVSGNRRAPLVEGDVTISNGSVQGVAFASVQARGRYADEQATFDALLNQAPGASLRAEGTVPVGATASARSMDVQIAGGPVSLGLAQAFTSEVDQVAGDADVNLRVTGTIADPIVNGSASVRNGAFNVLGTGVRYQTLEAALDFKDSQLAIRHFQAADTNGDMLTATGGIDVHRGIVKRAVDVVIRARDFSVLDNQFGTADMDLDVTVSGELAAPVIRGTARLDSGRLEVADILERTTATPYSTEPQAAPDAARAAPARAASPFERADLAVQVRLPDNLVLRGRGLRVSSGSFGIGDMNIVTGGTFDVMKPPGGVVDVRGALEVVRGTYTFQGRRFEIERGSDVRFRGGSIKDPLLNVNATREVSGVTAEVRLRGSARSPELTLSSRPPLDQSDILSLIVFNQPVNSLGQDERTNLGERAASLAAGAITTPLADSLGRALNLDVFEIQAPTGDDGVGAVTIGRQLGSRLLVGLRQQFGHSDASLLTLEYRVSRLLRFVTSVASGSLQAHATRRTDRGGVDLIFVVRY